MTEFLYQKFDLFDRSPIESFNPGRGRAVREAGGPQRREDAGLRLAAHGLLRLLHLAFSGEWALHLPACTPTTTFLLLSLTLYQLLHLDPRPLYEKH